jgi:hypothetical protein
VGFFYIYGGIMTVKCYEFFGCKKLECAMFNGDGESNCWELEPALTPCIANNSKPVDLEDKIVFCKNCLYYEHVNKDPE